MIYSKKKKAGFCAGYATFDHIFSLFAFSESLITEEKKKIIA